MKPTDFTDVIRYQINTMITRINLAFRLTITLLKHKHTHT